MKKRTIVLMHILVWSLFIAYEISFIYFSTPSKLQTFTLYCYAYGKNILLFYANLWCLNFCYVKRKSNYLYFIVLVFELCLYVFVHCILYKISISWDVAITELITVKLVIQYLYRAFYFISFSLGYWFVLQLLRSNNLINKMQSRQLMQQKRSAELERNLIKAQNAYLTSQINPHLLFNTLNFIYSSLYEVSRKSAEIVVLLSDMMRYSLTEIGEDGKVELYKEVEHIENMVQLNQARFNDKLNVKIYLSGDFEVRVIPLVFLTFIENIFKHGDLSDPECPALINISYHNNILDFYTSNKVRKVNINKGHGIGVENSITRLQMAYPDRYKLKNEVVSDQYITSLVIDFN